MRASHLPREFDPVSQGFATFSQEHGLRVLYAAVDRHGSWEWAAVAEERADEGLDRYVSLALTEREPVPGDPSRYLAEFWAEAEVDEDQRRVKRAKVHDFVTDLAAIPAPGFAGKLQAGLQKAWERASSFRAQELVAL